MSVLSSDTNYPNHVFCRRHHFLLEAFDVDSFLDVLPDVKVNLGGVQQVHDLLIVYFKIAASHQRFKMVLVAA
jgi:hypothetical protein